MRRLACVLLFGLLLAPRAAHAIGWDSDDFLIGGGLSFTTRIGVFDHDLTFKGYLETGFVGVAGADFDAQGRLAAVSGPERSVRVYASSGSIVGGFTRADTLLGTSGDLKVAPDGSYVVATQDFGGGNGARQFAPDGAFVRQFGSGQIQSVAVVPGNRIWIGGVNMPSVLVFSLSDGASVGSISVAGLTTAATMSFSPQSQTVLISDTPTGTLLETDLAANVVRTFVPPSGTGTLYGITRGPANDVFATTSQNILRWDASGAFLNATPLPQAYGSGLIVWAGNAPEPGSGFIAIGSAVVMLASRRRAAS